MDALPVKVLRGLSTDSTDSFGATHSDLWLSV